MKRVRVLTLNHLAFVLSSAALVSPLSCGDDSSLSPAQIRSSIGDAGATDPTFASMPIQTATATPAAMDVDPSPTHCPGILRTKTATSALPTGRVTPTVVVAATCSTGIVPTPTFTTPVEPTPSELFTFPGCEEVAAESHYCLTLSGNQVTLVGLDSGRVCAVTSTDAPIGASPPGASIAWQHANLYTCGKGGLIRISLRDGSWEKGGKPCVAVASYHGGLMLNRWLLTISDSGEPWRKLPLSWYPDYEAVLKEEPERTFDLGDWTETMTVQGDRLYTAWHAGVSINVADLNENRSLGVLSLESYDGWMLGMSVTEDGYLVLSGDPWGGSVYVFDVYDGRQLARLDLPIRASGLACVASGMITPRDTPTATPTPTFNPAQPSTPTPCGDWSECEDPCSERNSDSSPFQTYELPPSIPIDENCLGGGYRSSNYAVPEELLVPDASEELHAIGVYEGRGNPGFRPTAQGVVEVTVHERPKPVVLALTSYAGMLWRITLDPGARLSRVILQGYEKQEVEGVPAGVPVIERRPEDACGYAYGWEVQHNTGGGHYSGMIASLRRFTGLVETSFQGCYAGNRFEVPYWSGDPPTTRAPTPALGNENLPRKDVTFSGCDAVTAESEYSSRPAQDSSLW